MKLLRQLALLALLAGAEAKFYGAKSSVLNVDSRNFRKEILESEHAAVVEFYAPWCGHCQNLKPAYEKVAASMKGLGKVAAIDCDDDKNKRVCGEHGIKGFPTLKLFRPTGKKGKPAVEDYNGPRTAKAIADALAERIPNHVTKVTANTLDDFLKKDNATAKAILFTTKGTTGALWKSLAIDFRGDIVFAQIRDKETAAAARFGVAKFPTVVMLPAGEGAPVVYEGKLAREPLVDFFKTLKGTSGEAEEPVEEEKKADEEEVVEPAQQPKRTLNGLKTKADLQRECFAGKAKTCLVALVTLPPADVQEGDQEALVKEMQAQFEPVGDLMEGLRKRGQEHAFNTFIADGAAELGQELAATLGLAEERPALVALSRKGWFRKFDGALADSEKLFRWIDAVVLGEAEKGRIPPGLLEEAEEPSTVEPAVDPQPEAEVKADDGEEREAEAVADEEEAEQALEEEVERDAEERVHDEL